MIGEIHERSRRTYGAPRIHAELRRLDRHCSRKRVARLMRARSLVGVHARPQHSHPTVDDLHGIEALKSFIAEFQTAFPDFLDTVERQVAEADVVTTQFTSAGTHRGEFLGIGSTGRRVEWMGIEIARVEGGKIVENWVSWDIYGMLQQLGALPGHGVAHDETEPVDDA